MGSATGGVGGKSGLLTEKPGASMLRYVSIIHYNRYILSAKAFPGLSRPPGLSPFGLIRAGAGFLLYLGGAGAAFNRSRLFLILFGSYSI